MSKANTECVKVMVRCRPMNKNETKMNCLKCIGVDQSEMQVSCFKHNVEDDIPRSFTYDQVYDDDSKQQDVYDECAFPLVESVLKGYNGTIFAYGQTGCGKTFTMIGDHDKPGLLPFCLLDLFE